jgi:putative methionine-R-sulfoxide reductase with GAF domain
MLQEDKLIGVLDLDSSSMNSFDERDSRYLQNIITLLLKASSIQ